MEIGSHDVVVMGGGLAGLSLARQLRQRDPNLDVLVVERTAHPPEPAAHKVGESTLEVQGHYLGSVLGLRDYLETEQLRKAGLRFFFSDGRNADITRRVEFGPSIPLVHPSFQLDRGTLEAKLAEHAMEAGARFVDRCTVRDFTLGDDRHRVRLRHEGEETEVEARWLVDATGRFQLMKRKLGLAKETGHKANAAWFRLPVKIDVSEWSDDPAWQERLQPFRLRDGREEDMRYLSTNHLAGYGYWVWLIPLANGITSVGIVVDDSIYPISEINTLDKALAWLEEREPQVHAAVVPHRERLMDFKFLRHYAHDCKQVYSRERWCITGIAGAFQDPLFSFGGDMIAYSNTFVTDLIARDFAGEDIGARTDLYNDIFLNQAMGTTFTLFEGKYPLIGNPQVFAVSVHWTTCWYWAVFANLFLHDKLTEISFLSSISEESQRAHRLMRQMQSFFIDWHRLAGNADHSDYFIPYCCHKWIRQLHCELTAEWTDEEFVQKYKANVANLEELACEIFWMGARALPDPPERRPIDPYAISLKPERWEEDGLFDAAPRQSPEPVDWDAELGDYVWFEGREAREPALSG